MTQFVRSRSVNARDDLEREVFPGVYVGKFPADAVSARMRINKNAPTTHSKGAYRTFVRLRRGAAMSVAAGVAAALAVMALGRLDSAGNNGDLPPGPEQVEAPRTQAPRLSIARTIAAVPSAQTPLHILIDSRDELPTKSYLNISGLPPAILLSAGRTIGPGEWVIPIASLSNIMISVPAEVSGKFEMVFTLVAGWEETRPTITAQARATLVIAPLAASVALGPRASGALSTGNRQNSTDAPPPADNRTASATAPEPTSASVNAAPGEAPARGPVDPPASASSASGEVASGNPTTDTHQNHTDVPLASLPARPALATLPVPVTASASAASVNEVPVGGPHRLVIRPAGASVGPDDVASAVVTSDAHQASTDAAPQRPPTAARSGLATASEATGALAPSQVPQSGRAPPTLADVGPHPVGDAHIDQSELSAPHPIPTRTSEERSQAEDLIAQGERYLADGNVGLARQLFQRAADAGIARGALLLGATYDPRELASLHVLSNPAVAHKWYERARALSAPKSAEARKANSKLAPPTVVNADNSSREKSIGQSRRVHQGRWLGHGRPARIRLQHGRSGDARLCQGQVG